MLWRVGHGGHSEGASVRAMRGAGRRSRGRRPLVFPAVIALAVLAPLGSMAVATPSSAAAAARTAPSTQYGINVYVTENCAPSSVWQSEATNEMQGIKSLGANSVGIAFPFYTAGVTANSEFAANRCPGSADPDPALDPQSPTPARLAVLVQAAATAGLQVLLRPELNEVDLRPKWRGVIAPTEMSAWFTSYQSMLDPYLQMAQADKVTRFDISVELSSLATAAQWTATISSAEKLYSGQVVFDGDWVGTSGRTGMVPHPHTAFGVDTYPKLPKATPSYSVSQLVTQWNGVLLFDGFPLPGPDVTIDEVGIVSEDGAYTNPSTFSGGPFDQKIQANWFAAACDFAKSHKLAGIYFWGAQFSYNSGKLIAKPDPTQPTEMQPQSQAAIKACFK